MAFRRAWRIPHQVRHPVVLRRGSADIHVQSEGPNHRRGKEVAESVRARRSPYHLADEPAEGDRVVALLGAGLPDRCLTFEGFDHSLPVEGSPRGQVLVDHRKAGLVREEVPNGHCRLAHRSELGPVLGHRGVEVEPPLIGEDVGTKGSHPFGRRVHVDERVPRPGSGSFAIGPARPQVSDGFPVEDEGKGGPHLSVVAEVPLESVVDRFKAGGAGSANLRDIGHVTIFGPRNRARRAGSRPRFERHIASLGTSLMTHRRQ